MSEIPLSPGEQRALYRRLVSQPQWLVYVSRWGPFHLRSPQNGWVTLFSSKEDLALAQAQSPEPIETLTMSGHEPFALYLGARAGLCIDPASPGAIHFKKHQLAHLQEWGRGYQVERMLWQQRITPWVARAVVDFTPYLVPVIGQGKETRYMNAEDAHGRSGLALFTLEDALHNYIEAQSTADRARLRVLRFSGTKLFESLYDSQRSVVLNEFGPGAALQISAIKLNNWLDASRAPQ